MADVTTTDPTPAPAPKPAPQTDPLAAGKTTTEFYVAKIVTILATVSAFLGFAMDILTKAQVLLPTASWLNGVLVIGGIVGACVSQLIYTLSRVQIKKAALVFAPRPADAVIPVGPGSVHDKAVEALDG